MCEIPIQISKWGTRRIQQNGNGKCKYVLYYTPWNHFVIYDVMIISNPLHNQTQFVADPPSIESIIFPVHWIKCSLIQD